MADTTTLLAPQLRGELDALRRRLRPKTGSGALGEVSGRQRGGRTDFEAHRPYGPGDDLRLVDWAAFARSGEAVVKEFRAEQDVVVRLLLDASASLGDEAPSKLDHALSLLAAFGYLSLAAGQRVQPWAANGARRGPLLGSMLRGRAATGRLVQALAQVQPCGQARLADFITSVVLAAERPGLLVVISDFLEQATVLGALDRARQERHEVILLQVLAQREVAPELEGDLLLVDPETGEAVEVTVDERSLAAYHRQLDALTSSLATWARQRGATYLLTTPGEATIACIRRLLGSERLR
jgi:uncharacterized protein (DUF58 family)